MCLPWEITHQRLNTKWHHKKREECNAACQANWKWGNEVKSVRDSSDEVMSRTSWGDRDWLEKRSTDKTYERWREVSRRLTTTERPTCCWPATCFQPQSGNMSSKWNRGGQQCGNTRTMTSHFCSGGSQPLDLWPPVTHGSTSELRNQHVAKLGLSSLWSSNDNEARSQRFSPSHSNSLLLSDGVSMPSRSSSVLSSSSSERREPSLRSSLRLMFGAESRFFAFLPRLTS